MAYRNDHDAALARVDALQRELTQLRQVGVVSLPPIRATRTRAIQYTVLGAVLAGLVASAFGAGDAPHVAPPAERIATLDTRVNRTALDACIDQIRAMPDALPQSADGVVAIEATGAPCRLEIRDVAQQGLWSPTQQRALVRWADAEDALANRIAMIGVYHADSGHFADAAGASQLWREYSRAHADRDAAIAQWRASQ